MLCRPIQVVASGGISDGCGIAAAFMLGTIGVNLGTRFIASKEAPAPEEWKQPITGAESEDTIKVEVLNDIGPLPGIAGFHAVLRYLHTAFLDEWSAKRDGTSRYDHAAEPRHWIVPSAGRRNPLRRLRYWTSDNRAGRSRDLAVLRGHVRCLMLVTYIPSISLWLRRMLSL
jgi:hypothetical protein